MSTRVLVGVPSGDMVHTDFALSLGGVLGTPIKGVDMSLMSARGIHIERNRNRCVEAAQEWGATHLFFVDTDMTFPPYTMRQLLKHQKTVVAANALRRMPPFDSLATYRDGSLVPADIGLVEAGFLGTGVMLIKMSVFEKLEPPYFKTKYDETDGRFIGEDYLFCGELRKAGVKVYCDTDLRVGHIRMDTLMIPPAGIATRPL